jgi:hypothetical protein
MYNQNSKVKSPVPDGKMSDVSSMRSPEAGENPLAVPNCFMAVFVTGEPALLQVAAVLVELAPTTLGLGWSSMG